MRRSSREPLLYRVAKPYLDRMYPAWKVIDEQFDSGEQSFGGEYMRVETLGCVLTLVSSTRDGAEVSFSPSRKYSKDDDLDIPYMQWILCERFSHNTIEDQLLWFETHARWRTQWTTPRIFDRLLAIDKKSDDIYVECFNHYWWHGDANLDGPVLEGVNIMPRKLAKSDLLATRGDLLNLYVRSSGYLPHILGGPITFEVKDETNTQCLIALGPRLSARIDKVHDRERLSLAAVGSSADSEWLDIERITSTFDRTEIGRTIESKLYFALSHVESFKFIFSEGNFQAFLVLLERKEKLLDEFRHVMVVGLE